jgi:hypothetical protein
MVLATALAATLLWTLLDAVARSRWLAAWCAPLGEHGETPAVPVPGGAPTR